MFKELYFLTSNKNKAKEAEAILKRPIKITSKEIKEIQSLDLEEIVYHKVVDAYKAVKKPVFVEDVGIYIEAWNGFPGPFYRYINECGGPNLLLRMMNSEKNRNAASKVVVGFHDGEEIHKFIGEVKGKIANELRGPIKFGWDPVFIPEGYDKTFSELGPDIKNSISARRIALNKFKNFLEE